MPPSLPPASITITTATAVTALKPQVRQRLTRWGSALLTSTEPPNNCNQFPRSGGKEANPYPHQGHKPSSPQYGALATSGHLAGASVSYHVSFSGVVLQLPYPREDIAALIGLASESDALAHPNIYIPLFSMKLWKARLLEEQLPQTRQKYTVFENRTITVCYFKSETTKLGYLKRMTEGERKEEKEFNTGEFMQKHLPWVNFRIIILRSLRGLCSVSILDFISELIPVAWAARFVFMPYAPFVLAEV
ncbi:hypothetical protein L345_03712, partial [Ophiophagus hannah]